MDAYTAEKIVSELHFMPTWQFTSLHLSSNMVIVSAVWDTVNSNQDQAMQDYPERITLQREVMVYTNEYETEEEFKAMLFTWLMEIQFHESREFFRFGEKRQAPFHPHRPDTNRAFTDLVAGNVNPMHGTYSRDL